MSYTELSAIKVQKGRKNYRCEWCNTQIEKGESSISRSYVYEGSVGQDRWHPECWDASGKCEDDPYDGFSSGDYPRGGSVAFGNLP